MLRARYPSITDLRSAVLWTKGISAFTPDYSVEHLPTSPWIHQPFEMYDGMSVQQLEIGFMRLPDVHRMNAEGVTAIRVRGAQRCHGLEIRRPDRRHQKTADAGSPRRRQHRRPIAVELGGVQMAVGVDQHGARRGVTYPSRPACAWP